MDLASQFKAVADESRLRLLGVLSRGSFTVQDLTGIVGLSQPTISHHLKVLQSCGLVKTRREGTWNYASLVSAANGDGSQPLLTCVLDLLKKEQKSPLASTVERDLNAAEKILAARRADSHAWFESVAGQWREIRDQSHGPAHLHLEQLAAFIPRNGVLVELGCGSGALLEHLLPRDGTTIGVDYSEAMLSEARRNLGDRAANVDLRLGYLEHLPLPDHAVDFAVACMVMHHVAEPRTVFREVRRVLKPKGGLVISDLVRHDDERMREKGGDLWLGFEPEEFRAWLQESGFSIRSAARSGAKQEAFTILAVAEG